MNTELLIVSARLPRPERNFLASRSVSSAAAVAAVEIAGRRTFSVDLPRRLGRWSVSKAQCVVGEAIHRERNSPVQGLPEEIERI